MRDTTGRQYPGFSGYCMNLSQSVSASRGLAAGVFALAVLAQSPAISDDSIVPIPRPSPLTMAATGEIDPTVTGATLRGTPAGLSPGALLDPTNDVDMSLETGGATYGAAKTDIGADVPGALYLAPQVVAAGPSILGSNPLLGVPPPTAKQVPYILEARLKTDGDALPAGVMWRVFADHPGADGKLPLIGEARGGSIEVQLSPGDYLVHAAYGRGGATKKISVGPNGGSDTVIINAGGLKLSAFVGNDETLSGNDVSFDIYASDEDGSDERILLVPDAPPDQIVGLNAGVYHVICRYGDANAVVRADIRVEPGKLTEATIYQKAARLTLKLVSAHGGEALANTSWTILTPQGDNVVESVGAFPSVVLAAGDYTAVAGHQGTRYERNFTVEPGLNRDVEVIAKEN
jgi:hypothetical protein